MRHLILIRHTITRVSPSTDNKSWEITTKGQERALQFAELLVPYEIDAIYTSTFAKTKITGQILADRLALAIKESLSAFDENDRTGAPFYDSREAFETAVNSFFEYPTETVYGAETADAVSARFAEGIQHVLNDSPERTVAIVTHGVSQARFLADHMEMPPFEAWLQTQALGMPCGFVFTRPDLEFAGTLGIE